MKFTSSIILLTLVGSLIACDGPVSQRAPGETEQAVGANESTEADAQPLPERSGPRPRTSKAPQGTNIAHQQLEQTAPVELQNELWAFASTLPGVRTDQSRVSVPGARAFFLEPKQARGPRAAFMVATEFAHIHPAKDGSLHMRLPPELLEQAVARGWAEHHPRSKGTVMVYGPRDREELAVVKDLLRASYTWASGE